MEKASPFPTRLLADYWLLTTAYCIARGPRSHEAQLAHEAQLKKLSRRSGKDILVDGVMDGSYAKYLNGK